MKKNICMKSLKPAFCEPEKLKDKFLLFAYKHIILYYERKVKNNSKGFRKRKLQPYLKQQSITIKCSCNLSHNQSTPCSPPQKKSEILFSAKEYDIAMILRMLRHAFAHGSIGEVRVGTKKYYCFSNTYNNATTMVGQIDQSIFEDFIHALKNCR